jgi:trigger factor
MKIEKKNLPKGLIQFTIVVDEKEFESYHAKAFTVVQQAVEVDGFRKGNAPENLVVKKYGDMVILEEMANLALREAYVKAVEEHKINPISEPQVTITKIAKGNPLELTITVPVMPEFALPSYKKLAKESFEDGEKVEVTDKDIEDVLEELRKGRATEHDHHLEGHDHSGHSHADHEGHDHTHNESKDEPKTDVAKKPEIVLPELNNESKDEPKTDVAKKPEIVLPELNDDFAKSFGTDFASLADLKTKVGENLKLEKEQKLREKRRSVIMEKLVAETNADLPDVLIEGELNNMLAQMKGDITRFGGTWEEYLAHSKKTEDEIKKDWVSDAHKRALSQLILHKIAQTEKLTATEEEVEVELVRLLATVQDADEERAKAYLYQTLTNDKVLKFLEQSS